MTGQENEGASPDVFSPTQVWLHWIIAGLIFFQLVFNEGIETSFTTRMNGLAPAIGFATVAHVGVGAVVLGLTLWRLTLRLRIGVPPPEADANLIVRLSSKLTHLALYALALGMPLTGGLAWFGHSDLAAELHELGKTLLYLVIALHVLGALFEHSIMGNDTLARMLRPGGTAGDDRAGQ